MVRLVIFLVFFAALVLAVTSVLRFLAAAAGLGGTATPAATGAREDPMPALMRNLAYALLLALMIGITTGWLGGL